MKVIKKVGWFIVAMLPAILFVLIQAASVTVGVVIALNQIANGVFADRDQMSLMELVGEASKLSMEHIIYIVLLYQITAVLIFGLWYYLAYGRKVRPAEAETINGKKIRQIALLGLGLQLFLSAVLNGIYMMCPQLLDSYIEIMENSGIGEVTLASLLATVILAPIGEELVCRGITFRLAHKVSSRFWVANTIQALVFGVLHGNWIQGAYAFGVGMILGYIYGKYRNIWICMLMHGIINFLSYALDACFSLFPEQLAMPVLLLSGIGGVAIIIVSFKKLGKVTLI